jgi:Asp-tRNA(Asn)/Glu-tRNA(Gln) amidotransferase A subunit family amidase
MLVSIEYCFNRINKFDPSLNAFITVDEKDAYNNPRIAEKEVSHGNYRGPLHGIPFSIKDIIYVNGIRCTAGSKRSSLYLDGIHPIRLPVVRKFLNIQKLLKYQMLKE